MLFSRRNFLHEALMATACILFGDDRVDEIEHPLEGWFVVVDEYIVIDIIGYYFWKRDKDDTFAPSQLTRLLEDGFDTVSDVETEENDI